MLRECHICWLLYHKFRIFAFTTLYSKLGNTASLGGSFVPTRWGWHPAPPRGLCRGQVYQGSQQERVSAWVKMDMVFNHSMLNLLLQNTWLQLLNERVVRSLFDQCGALPAGSCNWYPGIRHSVPFSVSALCASCGTVTLLIHLWHGLVRLQYLANEGFSSLR